MCRRPLSREQACAGRRPLHPEVNFERLRIRVRRSVDIAADALSCRRLSLRGSKVGALQRQ